MSGPRNPGNRKVDERQEKQGGRLGRLSSLARSPISPHTAPAGSVLFRSQPPHPHLQLPLNTMTTIPGRLARLSGSSRSHADAAARVRTLCESAVVSASPSSLPQQDDRRAPLSQR